MKVGCFGWPRLHTYVRGRDQRVRTVQVVRWNSAKIKTTGLFHHREMFEEECEVDGGKMPLRLFSAP